MTFEKMIRLFPKCSYLMHDDVISSVLPEDKITENRNIKYILNEIHKNYPNTELFADEMDSEMAYWWARYVGDRELMRDRITEDRWAFAWAYEINADDADIMRDKVKDPGWVLEWDCYINDRFKRTQDAIKAVVESAENLPEWKGVDTTSLWKKVMNDMRDRLNRELENAEKTNNS